MWIPSRHPSIRALVETLDTRVPRGRETAVDRHIRTCDACQAALAQIESATVEGISPPEREAAWRLDAVRARVGARMAERLQQADPSWSFPAAWRFAIFVRLVFASAAIAGLVVAVRAFQPNGAPSQRMAVETMALPIAAVTPGAVRPMSLKDVCEPRAATKERISSTTRLAILNDYGMTDVPADEYELDYLVTPELGGTADRRNLWPERYDSPIWNARVKDGLERLLPELVCKGAIDVATAQHDIAADWIRAYQKYFHSDRPLGTLNSDRFEDDDEIIVDGEDASLDVMRPGRMPERHFVAFVRSRD